MIWSILSYIRERGIKRYNLDVYFAVAVLVIILLLPYFFALRAKNGARTRDPDLGKVVLCQLSYFRIESANIQTFFLPAKPFSNPTAFQISLEK